MPGKREEISASYQFDRALQAMQDAQTSDEWQEAGVHATLAQAAYTRELAEAVRRLDANLAEIAHGMLAVAQAAR